MIDCYLELANSLERELHSRINDDCYLHQLIKIWCLDYFKSDPAVIPDTEDGRLIQYVNYVGADYIAFSSTGASYSVSGRAVVWSKPGERDALALFPDSQEAMKFVSHIIS